MKASTARGVAWSIGVLSIAFMLAGLVFMFVDRHAVLPDVSDSWTFSSVFDVIVNIAVPVIGLVIASRRRENPLGWLLLIAGLGLGLMDRLADSRVVPGGGGGTVVTLRFSRRLAT